MLKFLCTQASWAPMRGELPGLSRHYVKAVRSNGVQTFLVSSTPSRALDVTAGRLPPVLGANDVWATAAGALAIDGLKLLRDEACVGLPVPLLNCAVVRMNVFEFMWSEFEPGFPAPGIEGQRRGHAKKPPEGFRAFCLKKSDDAVVLLSTITSKGLASG
jgi:hypothetical protein